MKLWLYGLGMCQSMFCALPFPWHGWEEKARDKMLLCLPIIGLEIGLIWWGIAYLLHSFELPQAIRAAAVCAVPWLLTGFMHLDGFMDVTDAVRSYRSLERRREILKDSHVGSFAVIGIALVLLTQFSAAVSMYAGMDLRVMALIPVVSRCCSVLAILTLPPMTTSQYAEMPKKNAAIPAGVMIAVIAFGFTLRNRCGIILIITALAFGLALLRAYRSLKGMNGDISGYCITIAELAGLLAMPILYR